MDNINGVANPCPEAVSGVSAHLFLTLINTLMSAKCQINSPQNYPVDRSLELNNDDEFDFIIIGAGSAGSVVANKLSENSNWKILVLEAGTIPSPTTEIPSLLFSLQQTSEDWQYKIEHNPNACLGLKEKRCAWPRGKCLGGSSSINANLYIRGNKKDYDGWAELENDGWDYDSVLKYFLEMEDLQSILTDSAQYGRGGYLPLSVYHADDPIKFAIQKSAEEFGYPTVLEEQNLGYFDALQTVEKGLRANAAKSFLGKIKDRRNLMVASNSFVERILIDGQKRVRGVEANISNKKLTLKARKEVILSAGAVNSPHILMLSGIGPKQHLENIGIEVVENLPVGENLQDHLFFVGLDIEINDAAVNPQVNVIDELYKYFMYHEGPLGQIGLTNFVGFINTRNESIYPNIQLLHVLFQKNDNYLLPTLIRVLGLKDEIALIELEANKNSPILKILPTLINPKSRGKILLRSRNSSDKPLIFANYFEDVDDIQTMLEGIQYVLNQLKTKSFKKFDPKILNLQIPGCEMYEFNSDDYWRCALKHLATSVYHPVGTCKMGPKNDPEAVVNSKLKVHGISNLRVIDASIMPLIPSVNTNAPTLMIGRKGATMIMDEWSHHHQEL